MNVAKRSVGIALRWRTYATAAYVPPASLENFHRRREPPPKPKIKPQSPNFYTARSTYYDEFNTLETALHHTRSALRALELHPLPDFARASLPPIYPTWQTKEALTERFGGTVTMTRYRRFLALLDELLQSGKLVTNPVKVIPGGLNGVKEGWALGKAHSVCTLYLLACTAI